MLFQPIFMKPTLFERKVILHTFKVINTRLNENFVLNERGKSHNNWSRLSMTTVGCYVCQTTASHRLQEVPKERLGDLVPFPHQGLPQISDLVKRGKWPLHIRLNRLAFL